MNNELERNGKKVDVARFKALSRDLPEGSEENHKNQSGYSIFLPRFKSRTATFVHYISVSTTNVINDKGAMSKVALICAKVKLRNCSNVGKN
jgi:hypothetical protein